MAIKGQKFKQYDLAFKKKVLNEYRAGYSQRYLSEKYDIPGNTIVTWSRIEKKYGGLDIAKKGAPKKDNKKDYKERYEILKKFQDFLDNKEPKKK
jgi:transposase